jgi:DNA-binding response OmpR family regulator
VARGGRRIELTPIEFALLDLFLENPETVLARSFISQRVWGFDFGSSSNSLNVYVGHLRRRTQRVILTNSPRPGTSPGPFLPRDRDESRARVG